MGKLFSFIILLFSKVNKISMIKNFVLSEKSVKILEIYNRYVLDVDANLTKLQIRIMIEKTFFVQVTRVNTFLIIPTKKSKSITTRSVKKRAIVTVRKGIKIPLY